MRPLITKQKALDVLYVAIERADEDPDESDRILDRIYQLIEEMCTDEDFYDL